MRLELVVDVDDADPTRTDPHDVADELLDLYTDEARAGNVNHGTLTLVSAEWVEQARGGD